MMSSELHEGIELWKDRQEDVYPDDDYFAYVERIKITGVDDRVIWFTRQHIYVDGVGNTVDQDGWQVGAGTDVEHELLATGSSEDELEMRKDYWDSSWAQNKFYTKQEIKRRVVDHLFERYK